MRQELLQIHFWGSALGCWQDSQRHLPHSGHMMEGLVAHSGGGSLLKVVAAGVGCLLMVGSTSRVGR